MTSTEHRPPAPRRERERRRRARRRGLGLAVRVLVVAAVFAAGLALGQALDDSPGTGSKLTEVRTLKPLPLPPAERTVTVTVP